ncbi:hypothetical protein pipiens_019449 [Culex pipiens pipiens]|uniref:Lipase domain-containing protein n=1 Tax=Culex pipiens pipiens TaxID=38569 RepID=A0ABD1DY83_CULPP
MWDLMFLLTKNNIKFLLSGKDTTPIEQAVTFWCGNSESRALQQTFPNNSRIKHNINPTKPMHIIVHGWLDNPNRNWVQATARNLLEHLDTNVCIVGWRNLAHYYYSLTARVHTVKVSNHLTQFITFLNDLGLPLKNITLIGHSLGAHISGQVGHNFHGQIGAIYGLDPPGTAVLRRPRSPVSAGSQRRAPNCVLPLFESAEFSDLLFCSHLHVTTLFRLSIVPGNAFVGRECASYGAFLHKRCASDRTNRLGIYSDRSGGDFYLKTTWFSPFVSSKNERFLPKMSI